MGTTLRDFAPQIIGLLVGGLASSLGMTYASRAARWQATLARTSVLRFGLVCTGLAGVACLAAFWQARAVLAGNAGSLERIPPEQLLLFGLLIGVPLSLPGLVFAWSDARARAREREKKKDFVPTRDDRRKFADDLVRQIEDVSPRPRRVVASVTGDGGRVLILEGDIDSAEGERLTKALRADLSEVGFKRVEGKNGAKEWWTRV